MPLTKFNELYERVSNESNPIDRIINEASGIDMERTYFIRFSSFDYPSGLVENRLNTDGESIIQELKDGFIVDVPVKGIDLWDTLDEIKNDESTGEMLEICLNRRGKNVLICDWKQADDNNLVEL